MTILCGRTKRAAVDGPVVKAIFAVRRRTSTHTYARTYACIYLSFIVSLPRRRRPFRSLIPVRKYSVESLVYTGQHIHPKTLYNVLLNPLSLSLVPPSPYTHAVYRPPVFPTLKTARCAATAVRSYRNVPIYSRLRAPHEPTYEFQSRGMSFVRTGRAGGGPRRVKEPEIPGPSRRWTKGIGKQLDGFKCRARPDFNGRFTKSYRLPFRLHFRVYIHVRL